MSINRPKRVNFRASREADGDNDATTNAKPVDWAAAVAGKADDAFRAYGVKETFASGDFLRHPKFGNGLVVAVENGKIDVLFESGERKLVHALG